MNDHQPVIVVHGGAGSIADDTLPARLDGCKEAALEGWRVLAQRGSALDAVETAVVALENNPLFNAGTGSALNSLGQVEMDAAIMDGKTLSAGAVGAVSGIKNPISLARKVMEESRHVLLVGEGALLFAREKGIPECPPESLILEAQRARWERKHGTVGCVALDSEGRIAAGTSTGGIFDKFPGRVGDSPLLGCGTYAEEAGGVSCTGDGEAIIRVVMAKTALELLHAGFEPMETARQAVSLLEKKTGAKAGLIIIGRHGRVGYFRNTDQMPVSFISATDQIVTDS